MPIERKTSLDGRVTYKDIDYTYLTANDMRKAGEKVAEAFPNWKVEVDGGPYRGYDVAYTVKWEEKIIELDFYSANPGLGRMDEVIEEMRGRMLLGDTENTWTP